MGRFDGKVAWITGGGTGIGRALALEMAIQGANVAVSGRRLEPLEEVVSAIESAGGRGLAVCCDVTDEDSVKAAIAAVTDTFGRLDVAVANAGFSVMGTLEKLSVPDWRRQFEVNVLGAVSTAHHVLPDLKKTDGRLVFVASVAAFASAAGGGPYSASKFALRAIGLAASQELAGTGVSSTLIHPGFVESQINQVNNQGTFNPDKSDDRPQNLMWPADRAARVIAKAIYKRKREFVFTGHGKFIVFLGAHFPGLVHFIMTRKASRKRVELMTAAK